MPRQSTFNFGPLNQLLAAGAIVISDTGVCTLSCLGKEGEGDAAKEIVIDTPLSGLIGLTDAGLKKFVSDNGPKIPASISAAIDNAHKMHKGGFLSDAERDSAISKAYAKLAEVRAEEAKKAAEEAAKTTGKAEGK